MTSQSLLFIILAAGKGTRMKSARSKVLHTLAGRSLLGHAIALGQSAAADRLAVVVGPDSGEVAAEVRELAPTAETFVQEQQLGTAHAVLAARGVLEQHQGDVVVVYADTPLVTVETLGRLRGALSGQTAIAVLAFEAGNPEGYGRIIVDGSGAVTAIREHADASPAEHTVALCNSGIIAFRTPHLAGILERIGKANAKGEYYLTDAVAIAAEMGLSTRAVVCDEDEVLGINSREQLAQAERMWQRRARSKVMAEGATLIDPDTVWLSYDTRIGRDVLIEPNVFIGPGVVIEDGVTIKANCHLQGVDRKSSAGIVLRRGAEIGPFARLRPGTEIGTDAHIGNFVEVKNARFEEGAKASHLTYIGDARVGADANIGAGTITCNYDGFGKNHTDIGAGAFIGSNTALVAPVKVGDNAYVGAGSVISGSDVAPGSLAVVRGERRDEAGWVARFKARMQGSRSKKTTGQAAK
jgi:bifunctional UDP-N-acetylglucosamine pyrophosphorylase/glucosamine-1-phosphate N-acetyltransferase